MAKISNKIKVKNEDGTFEDIQISYIGSNGTWAEGEGTVASGKNSHAEGFNTIASGYYQHVQGSRNIEDTENKYLHIVGNSTSSTHSNAHTLDWNGNAWYAGDIKLGGTGQDDPLAFSLLDKITALELKIQLLENKLNTI